LFNAMIDHPIIEGSHLMADTWIHSDFKRFAAPQSEPAFGGLESNPETDRAEEGDPNKGKEDLNIWPYQDPRDQLDQERHAKKAR
jgi:hypothetical protein